MPDPADAGLREECERDDAPFPGDEIECWQCGGEGIVIGTCWDGCCINAEDGCDVCNHQCDICKGKGGWTHEPPAGRLALQGDEP